GSRIFECELQLEIVDYTDAHLLKVDEHLAAPLHAWRRAAASSRRVASVTEAYFAAVALNDEDPVVRREVQRLCGGGDLLVSPPDAIKCLNAHETAAQHFASPSVDRVFRQIEFDFDGVARAHRSASAGVFPCVLNVPGLVGVFRARARI